MKLVDEDGIEILSVHEAVLTRCEALAEDLKHLGTLDEDYTILTSPIAKDELNELVHWLYMGKLSCDLEELKNLPDARINDVVEILVGVYSIAESKKMGGLRDCILDTLRDIFDFHSPRPTSLTWFAITGGMGAEVKPVLIKPIADEIRWDGWGDYLATHKDVEAYLKIRPSFAVELKAMVADSPEIKKSEQN